MNKTMRLNNKLFLPIRVFIILIFLSSFNFIYATSDTLQTATLNKAYKLIVDKDSASLQLCEKIDSINSIYHLSDSAFSVFLARDIGNYFRRQGEQSNVIEIFADAVIALEQKKSQPNTLMRLYLPLGAAYEEVGLWSSAMDYYHKALRLAQDNNLQADIARIYNNIGAAYYGIDIEKSEEYMYKSLAINSDIGDKEELFLNYNNLAAIYLQQKEYDEALDHALQALQLLDKKSNPEMYHSMQYNIGSIYLIRNEIYLSISYINNAKDFFEEVHNYSELTTVYMSLSEAYEKAGDYHKSAYFIHLIEDSLLQHISNDEVEADTRTQLSAYYEKNKNHPKALEHLKAATILKDSLTTANNAWRIDNMERIYDNEQKLRENTLIINEMHVNKLQTDRNITIVVIALIVIIVFIILLFVHSQYKINRHRTNTQLAEQQLELQEKEKELQQIKEKELKSAIDQKNRELSSYALSHTKDNEFLTQLSEELKKLLLEINPRNKEHKEHIRNILAQIKQHSNADNWQEFRYYFEQVHPSFYDKLEEISPGITQHQKRLCAMLYIGLSTKEISSITFREIRSIESARNRLRKKMQVASDETIQDFLSRKMTE